MSKLSPENKFIDLSDYGRPPAKLIAKLLLNTFVTPVHVTFIFLVTGIIAIFLILNNQFLLAAIFLALKSIIDAADGELARLRNKPSYIGRYLDSIFDLILNFIILYSIAHITNSSMYMMLGAFIAIQLQGTIYNYYYTILRNNIAGGDTTSRIEEKSFPKALHGESQKTVNFLFIIFSVLYGGFDKIVLGLDSSAKNLKNIPNWFMTFTSIYGLGFQLLIIGIMLTINLASYILPFFIYYSLFIIILIGIRKFVLPKS